jgi:hypothetical protein
MPVSFLHRAILVACCTWLWSFSGNSPAAPAAVNLGSVAYVGTLEIEIGGTLPGSGYDQLNHVIGGGMAFLGGALEVTLWGGFIPAAGDQFEFLTATGGVSGVFASARYPALSPGLHWQLLYGPNTVTLSVVTQASYTTDFDEDGDVDGDDLVQWKAGYSIGSQHMDGDADADGDVDGSDLITWQQQVGSGTAAAIGASIVAEPAAWTIGAATVVLTALQRAKKRVAPGR